MTSDVDLFDSTDPLWYKDAIIYELNIRSFYDSNKDGMGDFPGLTEKLDYLADLGITTIWLLPFYPSPLKDGGYDISDYTNVNPIYGTLSDARTFIREAARRGLRVMTELPINHTSDQHAWFQRARRSPPGSAWRDFYVWSDTPEKYRDARVIFKDFESSNWAWDPVAKAYYWHRFYSHQPDLNFESPHVRRAVLRTMDFWLRMGVSGLRLDAIPYLYEKEGTNCENLPETHAFIKTLRRHIDQRFQGRVLLAEANQWPEDAVAYFGDGDECHMAYHFPVMPRMFMAIRMEDRFPIVDILQDTPPIPDTCQWVMFLRNHDELTLEMVTDEERDYMYRVYAHDPHARVNLGIRRRLAPLLNNDRRKIELMNALLFSLPGTPTVYYGDEIGMGDNFYLGDRDGVRTPMQWSADRNAGFSRANPQSLFLPPIIDPEYHYESVNVENQQANPDSLLWWMKRTIALRKRFKAFGRGDIQFLFPENRKVLAFVRTYQEQTILVVANLSRQAQHAFLDLSRYAGRVPVELFGGSEFHPIGDTPYSLTLGPYAFYWFSLEPARVEDIPQAVTAASEPKPVLTAAAEWEDLLRKESRPALNGALLSFIRKSRWFGGKARTIRSSAIVDVIPLSYDHRTAYLLMVQVEYKEGDSETYTVPLAAVVGKGARERMEREPQAVIAHLHIARDGQDGVLFDAMYDAAFCGALLDFVAHHRRFKGLAGQIIAVPTRAFRTVRGPSDLGMQIRVVAAEQSNTSVAYGDRMILKLYRRLSDGMNPELEIGRFLTEKASFPNAPPTAGFLEYRPTEDGDPATLGILQGFVRNQGDAWKYTLDALGHYFEQVLTHPNSAAPPIPDMHLLDLRKEEPPPAVAAAIGPYLVSARLLGQRTAELHLAMASAPDSPDFAPEPFSLIYQRSLYHSMRSLALQSLQLLRRQQRNLTGGTSEVAERVLASEARLLRAFGAIREHKINAMRVRIHGDYHLGQVLHTGNDFVIIDFEGEPARPLSERRLKRSPLRDVAGMIRSFHYASHAALLGQAPTVIRPADIPILERWASSWYHWVAASFLDSYLQLVRQPLLPEDPADVRVLTDAFLLEKAVYEVAYELNNRPDWVVVPLQGILQLIGDTE